MQSTGAKIAVAIAAVAVIVVLFVVLQGNDDKKDTASTTTTVMTHETNTGATGATGTTANKVKKTKTIVLKDGKPVGGVAKLEFNKGGTIAFAVKPDVDGDIHIHGYNVEKMGSAGKVVKFSFPANIDGVFEVEDHGSNEQIAELTVNP